MLTSCAGWIDRFVLNPASAVNVSRYAPAAPDTTAEKKLAESAPK
jgi:hypothetical protein